MTDIFTNKFSYNNLYSYDRFMEYKLYDSKKGYYSKSNQSLWESDYYTSPMIHSSFAYMLARYIYSSWISMGEPKNFHLIELGGGGLYLIKEIINSLSIIANDFLKQCNILIIDKNFQNILNIDYELNLVISDTFCVKNISGFVISNELFDAFPFKRLTYKNNKYYEILFKINDGINEELNEIDYDPFYSFNDQNYMIENKIYTYSPLYKNMIEDIWNGLSSGVILSFDYGYTTKQLSDNKHINTDSRIIKNRNLSFDIYPYEKADISTFINFDLLNHFHNEVGFTNLFLGKQSDFLIQLGIKKYAENYFNSDLELSEKAKNLRIMQDLIDDEIFGNYLVLSASKNIKNLSQKKIVDKINNLDITF